MRLYPRYEQNRQLGFLVGVLVGLLLASAGYIRTTMFLWQDRAEVAYWLDVSQKQNDALHELIQQHCPALWPPAQSK